jgi:hypothetical protein
MSSSRTQQMLLARFAAMVAALLLIGAVFPHKGYGYFQLLRLAVSGAALFALVASRRNNLDGWAILFGIVIVLFNPILPIHLPRGLWQVLDLATAASFGLWAATANGQAKRPPTGTA